MLIGGIVLGLVLGLVAGGSLDHLARVRLRWLPLIFLAVVVRFGTEFGLTAGFAPVETLRLPLYVTAYGLLLAGLWVNRERAGLSLAFVGILSNAVAITINGGHMPIWLPSLTAAGFTPADVQTPLHIILSPALDAGFLLHAGPLGDLLPIPLPFVRNVASIGDLFLSAGLAFFLFATVVRTPQELDEAEEELIRRRLMGITAGRADALGRRALSGGSLAPGLAEASVLERPLVLGSGAAGMAAPAATIGAGEAIGERPPRPRLVDLARHHPYVRLALDGSFSALWVGQLISLFGDRIHQIALTFLVLGATNSPIAVGAVFVAATLPNLVFGPIAGTFVDRWDHREVMIVSDLLRGAIVLVIPIAAVTNLLLVYPLVFVVTTISIFFRPARVAILPQIVGEEDLVTANSALWIGETSADIVGYALAGLFVAFLGPSLPLAFWVDAATYVASAVLIGTIVVAPLRAVVGEAAARSAGFTAELREGWRFLRSETVLLANTLQATVAQFMLGIFLTLTPIYARDAIHAAGVSGTAAYSFIESAIGAGNLLGGFVVGLIGARIALGRMVIVGYAVTGACVAAMALTGNVGVAVGLAFGCGIGNLVFVIPSQTLFQQRTPPELMGRVIGFRFSLVFGSMTLAMAVGGVLGQAFGAPVVIGVFGLVTVLAGLAGLFVPALRSA